MKKLVLTLLAVFAVAAAANATNYKVDDSAIDALVEEATEVYDFAVTSPSAATLPATAVAPAANVNPAAAIILTFFLGGFGVHRHYMGTRPWMWAIYTFTVGGIFGIVPLVDFIVEIIAAVDGSSFSNYIGNTKFFMWA